MIKMIAVLKKRDDMTFEAFQDYYENHHAKLIANVPTAARYLRRYVTNYVDETGKAVEPDFHVITEVWFETQADLNDAVARLSDPEMAKVYRTDERNMLDMRRIRTFIADERETPLRDVSKAG
jgi:uncharacterized protein (TIGR02118 family)